MPEDDFTQLNTNQIDTEVLSIHTTVDQAISSTPQPIQFQGQSIVDSTYTHTPGESAVTILREGRYAVRADITTYKTQGNQRASSETGLFLNGSLVDGTRRLMYNRNLLAPGTSSCIHKILDLAENDVIEVYVRKMSGGGTVSLYMQGSLLEIQKIA
jgi:hypothetical protein